MIELLVPEMQVAAPPPPKPRAKRRTAAEMKTVRLMRAQRKEDTDRAKAERMMLKALTEEAMQKRMAEHKLKPGDVFEERYVRAGCETLGMRRVIAEINGIVFFSRGGDKNYHCKRETFFRRTIRCLYEGGQKELQ